MMRFPDWEQRLGAYFDEVADAAHEYGWHDCGLFVAGAVLAMTGVDFGTPFRGRYTTARGSVRAMRRHGAVDLHATLTAALGDPGPVVFAHRGDVVFYQGIAGVLRAADGVFVGRAATDDETAGLGLVSVPRGLLDAAWCVPFEDAAA